jgi:membrane-bound lytic murein transglycosylase D
MASWTRRSATWSTPEERRNNTFILRNGWELAQNTGNPRLRHRPSGRLGAETKHQGKSMAATVPAPAQRPRDCAPPRSSVVLVLAVLLAGACAPAGGSRPERPAPVLPDPVFLDESADGSGDPAGVEELLGDVDDEEPLTAPMVLDADGVARDLVESFPGFLAAGLPQPVLDTVLHYVGLFHAGRARANFERWLVREGRYRDLILSELEAAGLPEELLYLSMLESGFSPTAVSRAGAVGLWQFMPATGRAEGLRIDSWVDERRDPIASTRAATKHLAMLHDQLGDWALAAAAYNAGLGRVRRTRGDSGAGYFDLTLSGRLPAETRNYVPLILAASHVARNREYYGFVDMDSDPPLRYDTLRVDGRTRLSAVATASGLDAQELTALNTHLIRGAAPPVQGYPVRVPVGTASPDVMLRLAALPTEERLLPEYREIWAVVKSGDSWWRIARNHGVSVNDLRARNPRVGDVIHPGMRLLVDRRQVTDLEVRTVAAATPSTRSTAPSSAASSGGSSRSPGPNAGSAPQPSGDGTYRVRHGDTMSGIAAARGIRLADLARWNGMASPRPLREGEVLRLTPAESRRHRVQRGETLTSVARRYDVQIADLVRWNGLGSARPLREGETLLVEGPSTAAR